MTDIGEQFDAYYLALGKFVQRFAEVEAFIQVALWIHVGADVNVCRSIFSGTRSEAAIGLIRRIREAKRLAAAPDLESAFVQFGYLNAVRNLILHYGTQLQESGFVTTNQLIAHIPERAKKETVSPEVLADMTADLEVIKSKMVLHQMKGIAPGDWMNEGFGQIAQQPWRYKPPPQASKNRKTPSKDPE